MILSKLLDSQKPKQLGDDGTNDYKQQYQNSTLQSGNTGANGSQSVDQSQENAIGSYQTDATKVNTSHQINIYNFGGEINFSVEPIEPVAIKFQNKVKRFSFVEKLSLKLDKLFSLFK